MSTLKERVTSLEEQVGSLAKIVKKLSNGNGSLGRQFQRKITKKEGDEIRKRLRRKSGDERKKEVALILKEKRELTATQVRSAGAWERGELKGKLLK